MVRTALTLRWLPRHVLMLALVAALSLLGRWQWDVSESPRGGIQNFLYAFQWWFMAAMVIYGWWRLLRDAAYPHSRPTAEPAAATEVAADAWYRRPSRISSVDNEPATDDADDEDLAAYNEYLARLNDRAERGAAEHSHAEHSH